MKETALTRAEAQGRHVKQSGGHGQFAVCHLVMEPLPRGSGIEFDEVVVGGAVPRQFFSSVEKGVHHQLEKGLLAGWPVVDVKVTLTDGKAHSVDSSDVAFQTAAGLALREMASASTVCLLEPIDTVTVTVDDDYLGAVMTDIGTRRGQIIGSFAGRGPAGPVGARGRGAAARAARLRHQPALTGARHRHLPPRAPRLRAAARAPGQGPRGRARAGTPDDRAARAAGARGSRVLRASRVAA